MTHTFLETAGLGLLMSLGVAVLTWLVSLPLRDAGLADRVWSLIIAAPCCMYVITGGVNSKTVVMLALIWVWALRLALHITVRNWGHAEDRRYRDMRERHRQFGLKSIYLVFGLQGVLGWIVGFPLLAVSLSHRVAEWGWFDVTSAALASIGICVEAVADAQLYRFMRNPSHRDQVMDRGLWRYSRHPNYFGEACVWWGLGLMAVATTGASGSWSLISPLLMTVLLLKVSGITLLEHDISERRPGYRDYVARTNAFIPWPPRSRSPAMRQ